MKTHPAARLILKLQVFALWVGLGLVVGLAIPLSETLAAHLGQIGARQTGATKPNVDFGDMLRAAQ